MLKNKLKEAKEHILLLQKKSEELSNKIEI